MPPYHARALSFAVSASHFANGRKFVTVANDDAIAG
jgi:hypothetical protein